MNRHERRASAAERRRLGLSKDCVITSVDLDDPALAPAHRDNFIKIVRRGTASLDERIGNWYRHRGECGDPDCDCGAEALAAQAGDLCSHLWFIKQKWGQVLIDNYPQFARFLKDCDGGDRVYELLAGRTLQ